VLEELLREFDAAVAALPHSLSMAANEAAVAAGCHLIDLVGSKYEEKLRLHEPAQAAGVLLVTGCGVAPGIVNVLAARGIELLDEADEAIIYCGGLPRYPQPPLHYQIVFRFESVMGLYTRPASAVVDGEIVKLPPMAGLETVEFPEPVGVCEAAYSDAHSTAYTLRHKVRRLAEKTVRYPGHFQKMGVLAELGFLSEEPVEVDGQTVIPRRVAMAVLEPQLSGKSNEDVTVARVVVRGTKDGRPVEHEWTMVDLYDAVRGYTSMAKSTGFPAVIVTEWLAQGRLEEAQARINEIDAELALIAQPNGASLAVANATVDQARRAVERAEVDLALLTVRAPIDGTVLQVNVRPGEFAFAGTLATPLVVLGNLDPLHVRVDIDEADVPRFDPSAPAYASRRGLASERIQLSFVRIEPLLVPKRSLTGALGERVDTRVLRVIYALPPGTTNAYPGQQVDVFIESVPVGQAEVTSSTNAGEPK